MRLPFDLIVALMAVEAMRQHFGEVFKNLSLNEAIAVGRNSATTGELVGALCAFFLMVWLMHEWLARRVEWGTRWGGSRSGEIEGTPKPRLHPIEFHARGVLVIQGIAVVLFFGFLWRYRWNLRTCEWPQWLGLGAVLPSWITLRIANCSSIGNLMDVGPFVIAMILGWLPKHRLVRTFSGRSGSFWQYVSIEGRLTFLPLFMWVGIGAFDDVFFFGSEAYDYFAGTSYTHIRITNYIRSFGGASLFLDIGLLALFAVIAFPWLIKVLWQGRPFPEGELKARFLALLERSGVKARAILHWGPRDSSLANACVMGPWSRMRYIMISPGLVSMLSPEECEAVIAHEIGHARHGHLTLLIALLLSMMAASGLVLTILDVKNIFAQTAILLCMIGLFLRGLFGVISRQCEREADLTSAELMGTPVPLIAALEKLGESGGGTRDVYSWHHDSIAQRVEWLNKLAVDQEGSRLQHRRVKLIRMTVFASVVAGFAALAWMVGP